MQTLIFLILALALATVLHKSVLIVAALEPDAAVLAAAMAGLLYTPLFALLEPVEPVLLTAAFVLGRVASQRLLGWWDPVLSKCQELGSHSVSR